MFCNNCGKQVPDGSNFCSACGSRLNPTEAPEIDKIETPVENIDYEPDTLRETIRKPMVSFDWSEVKDEPHKKPAVNVVSPWGNTGLEDLTQHAEEELFVEPEQDEPEYSRTMSFIDILKKEREEKERAAQEATLNVTEKEEEPADYTAFNDAPQYYMPPLYENLEAELSAILDEGAATPAYEEDTSEKVEAASVTAELAKEFLDDVEPEEDSISALESMLGKIKEETPDAISELSDEPTVEAVETFDNTVEDTDFVDYEALMAELTGVDAEPEDNYEAEQTVEAVPEAIVEPEPTIQTEVVAEEAAIDDTLVIDELVDLYSEEIPEAEDSLFSSIFESAAEPALEPIAEPAIEEESAFEPIAKHATEEEPAVESALEPVVEEAPVQEMDARDAEIEDLKKRLAELMGTVVSTEQAASSEETTEEAAEETIAPAVEEIQPEPLYEEPTIDSIADLASTLNSDASAQEEAEPELIIDGSVFTTLPSWNEVEPEPAVTEEPAEVAVPEETVVTVEPIEIEAAEPDAESVFEPADNANNISDMDDDDEEDEDDDDDLPLIDPTPLAEEELSLVEDHEAKTAEDADSAETDAMSVEELERDLFGTVTEAEVEAEVTKKIDKFYTLYKKNEEFQRLLDEEYNKLKNEEEVVPTVSGVLEEASKAAEAAEAQPAEKAAEVTVTKDTGVVSAEPEVAEAPVVADEPATKAEVVDDAEESGKGGTALTVIAVVVAVLLVILLAIILVLNFAPDSGIAIKIDSIIEMITSYFSAVDATGNLLL